MQKYCIFDKYTPLWKIKLNPFFSGQKTQITLQLDLSIKIYIYTYLLLESHRSVLKPGCYSSVDLLNKVSVIQSDQFNISVFSGTL